MPAPSAGHLDFRETAARPGICGEFCRHRESPSDEGPVYPGLAPPKARNSGPKTLRGAGQGSNPPFAPEVECSSVAAPSNRELPKASPPVGVECVVYDGPQNAFARY